MVWPDRLSETSTRPGESPVTKQFTQIFASRDAINSPGHRRARTHRPSLNRVLCGVHVIQRGHHVLSGLQAQRAPTMYAFLCAVSVAWNPGP